MMASILIVDDEESIRLSLREFLRDADYEVGVAEDVDEAMRMLVAEDFDVLVTDIILPRVTGVELLKSIEGVSPNVQVILMTGEPTIETASEAVRAGAFDYLAKLLDKELFLKTVAKAARVKALDDERRRLAEENRLYRDNLEGVNVRLAEEIVHRQKAQEELYEHYSILRGVFDGTPDVIFVKDTEGRYRNVNSGFEQATGRQASEIIGRSDHEIFPPEIAGTFVKNDRRIMELEEAMTFEESLRSGDRDFVFLTTKTLYKDRDGKVLGIIGSAKNITERRRIEIALKQSEEKYRMMFESALHGIYQATPDGCLIHANTALAHICGYDSTKELISALTNIGHQLYVNPAQRDTFMQLMAEEGRLSSFEYQIYRKNGSLAWISETARAVRDDAGAIQYYEGFVIDISTQKRAVELEREKTHLQARNLFLQEELEHSRELNDLIGQSSAMRIIRKQLGLVAPTDTTVLIQGESGVGKEMIATEIYQRSHRKHKPMVRVNCASIPKDLYESEFFGHVQGAFTGAVKDRPGRFEAADGGTLFLDEVCEIPLELQGKLLRVLQEQQYERVGDDETRFVNVRIIAATNRDLHQEVEARRFRQDLFYRLNVFPLEAPPLRERLDDLPLLAEHLLMVAAKKIKCLVPSLTQAHISELQQYSWPGNIRELQNIIERAVITSRFGPLQFDLPNNVDRSGKTSVPTKKAETIGEDEIIPEAEMQRWERENLVRALRRTGGKLYGANGAAALLGVNPTTLASRIRKMGLQQSRSMKTREWIESLTT